MAELSGGGIVGRAVKAYKGDPTTGTLFIARTKTITLGSESIDVTSDGDSGFRTLLSEPAQRNIDMAIEGVLRQDDFVADLLNPSPATFLEQYTLVFPKIGSVTGDFFLSNVELGAPYNEATTFSATLESSGTWTFTPGAV